ncbi:endo-1,4-beta-xylanase 3-like [Gigantopelta aegis]|uniref:endo-1,4-beta-xylanase 3-like n=1 Tax=Gigantopelta aegis TaxID=1735272 RepID=UPI001B888DA4|nr:endo-1,4-beta-xylanase 3-like [Gigantopelta aegis]
MHQLSLEDGLHIPHYELRIFGARIFVQQWITVVASEREKVEEEYSCLSYFSHNQDPVLVLRSIVSAKITLNRSTMLHNVAFACVLSLVLGQELLQNPHMESTHNWDCRGFTCHVINTHHSGSHAIKASGRRADWQGVSQYVHVVPGTTYNTSAWVHLVNDAPGFMYQTVKLVFTINFVDGSHRLETVAMNRLVNVAEGWIQIRGFFTVPHNAKPSTTFTVRGPAHAINFIVDDASVQPLSEWMNWRQDTDTSITKLRKSPININVATAGNIDKNEVQIKITQLKKSFPFGMAINADEYDHGEPKYQAFVNKHFNWAVTKNALKWKATEHKQGHYRYERALKPIRTLRSHGIKVRGHNIVWATAKHVPTWVKPMYGDTLRQAVTKRVTDVVTRTKHLVEHWDIINENVHGYFFRDHVNKSNYNVDIFRLAHQTAPNIKMFLNDFAVVSRGTSTGTYLTQALKFKAAGVGLYGVGVQCHFKTKELPSPTILKARLDTIAEAGLPVWVTELSISVDDEHERAKRFDTVLRVLYSHPAVEGIMFWGFWGPIHGEGERAGLISGHEFRLNAAGQRVLDLFENQWMTKETHTLSQSGN